MVWASMFDDTRRHRMIERLRNLTPDNERRWGRMSAPQMIAHLSDQMRHCLGEGAPKPRPGVLRWAPVRFAAIYLLPWPKGRIKGPPEAFATSPTVWEDDLVKLENLVERFAAQDPDKPWPEHALFGHMTGRRWESLCISTSIITCDSLACEGGRPRQQRGLIA
jgi:hypothetical protein